MLIGTLILLCALSIFLILKIRKCFFKLLKDKDNEYFIKSRYIYLSSFMGSFLFPIIQAVCIMTMNSDKQGYIIALYFHTLLSIVVFIFFLFYFLRTRRLLCGFAKKKLRLRYFFVNTLLVSASYIVLLPIFWILFGLISIFYYAWH